MQQHLGAAAWVPRETDGVEYPWPALFGELGDEYERRYGLDPDHLAEIARINFANAKRNPNAQARDWRFEDADFARDSAKNPVIAGRIQRQDCSQVTDGAACVVLAGERFAAAWADRHGCSLDDTARLAGWGHRTARMALADKLADSKDDPYVAPFVRQTVLDAFGRAGVAEARDLDAVEVHDCFTTTEYLAIDHLGLTAPGESWRAIEDGTIGPDGAVPINPSGGPHRRRPPGRRDRRADGPRRHQAGHRYRRRLPGRRRPRRRHPQPRRQRHHQRGLRPDHRSSMSEIQPLRHHRPRPRPRGPEGPAGPDPLARPDPRHRLGLRHGPGLPPGAVRLLAGRVRLAHP